MSGSGQSGIWALIPAAGSGSRMASERPKQYLSLAGSPVIHHTIRAITAFGPLKAVLVGLAENDPWWPEVRAELGDLPCPLLEFTGGTERADTVLIGLREIVRQGGAGDRVLVHDAVRPLVTVTDIERLVNETEGYEHGGLLAVPVADTLKSEREGLASATVDRTHLWRALTPQYFPVTRLSSALERCQQLDMQVTDESSAIEQLGGRPRLVRGSADNIKLTWPSDMEMAQSLFDSRRRQD